MKDHRACQGKANESPMELSVESLLVATESSPESRKTEAGDGEYDNNDEGSVSTVAKGKRKKKAGRKATWSNTLLNDAVDIIVNNELFRRHLIFRNSKNQRNTEVYSKVLDCLKARAKERDEAVEFTPIQLRTKFKKAVSECKRAVLTMKTTSGIKRFQDKKGYGPWFDQLLALVKTRDTCQPKQAIEPSSLDLGTGVASSSSSSTASTVCDDLFVPAKVPAKKVSRKRKNQDTLPEAVEMFKTFLENDPMKDFIAFAQQEAEKSRQHELRIMEFLLEGTRNTSQRGLESQENHYQQRACGSTLYWNHLPNNMSQEVIHPPFAERRIDSPSRQQDNEPKWYYQF